MNNIDKRLRTTLLALVLTAAAAQGQPANATGAAAPGAMSPGFAFGNPTVGIRDAQIRATLLLGDNKQAWTWRPALTRAVKSEERTTPVGKATVETVVYTHADGFELAVYRTKLIGRQTETLRCELTNKSGNSVRLREFVMLDGRLDYQGAASNWMVSALTPGYHASGTLQQKLASTTKFQDDLTIFSDAGQSGVMIAPVRGEADLPCTISVDRDGKAQVSVVSDMSDIVLAPGETRSSEEVYVSFEPWRKAAQDRNQWVASNLGARIQRESLFGWCSWYAVASNVTSNDILSMIDFVKENRSDAPFNMVLIDEGWQVGRHQWEANDKFPGGLMLYADKIKSAGMMAGIWMCPITPNSRRIVDGKLKEFSLSGEVVRVFPESWYEGHAEGKPSKNALDPTHPEVQAYIRKWLTEVRNTGCNFFKLDFTIVSDSRNRHNNKLTRFQVQRELFKLYREAIGEDAYLLICSAGQPQRAATGYADDKRIGPDTIAGKGFDGHKTDDLCLLNGIKRMVSTANENGVFFSGDPDVTYVGATGPVSEPQMRSFHTFVGLYGGAAYFGGRLWSKEWTPEKLRWLGMVHPPAKEKGYPFAGGFDVMGEQFGMEVNRPWGNFVDVYLWHGEESDPKPRQMGIGNVPTANLGQRFHAYDFWNDKYLGVVSRDYTKLCNQYEGQLLRLTPVGKPGEPILVGSDLHLAMGAAEIQSVNSTSHGLEIELIAQAGARSGHLTFVSDRPMKLDQAMNCEAKLAQVSEKVWSLTLSHRSSEKNQLIRLTDH